MKLRIFNLSDLQIWYFEESQIKNITIYKQRKGQCNSNYPGNQPSQRMFLFFKQPIIDIELFCFLFDSEAQQAYSVIKRLIGCFKKIQFVHEYPVPEKLRKPDIITESAIYHASEFINGFIVLFRFDMDHYTFHLI